MLEAQLCSVRTTTIRMETTYCYILESLKDKNVIKIGVSGNVERRVQQIQKTHKYALYAPYAIVRKLHFSSRKEALELESVLLQIVGIDEEDYYNSFVGGCPELRYGGVKSVDSILHASNIEKIWACFWASKNSFIGCINIRDALALEINKLLKPQLLNDICDFEKNQTEAFELLECLAAPLTSGAMLDSDYDDVLKLARKKAIKASEKDLAKEIKQYGYKAEKIEEHAEFLVSDIAINIATSTLLPKYRKRLKEIQRASIALSKLSSFQAEENKQTL